MASMRDIKVRIKSIEGTQQITKAMKLVSTVKLQRTRGIVEKNKPFFNATKETIASILSSTNEAVNIPLLEQREVKKKAYILITGDRGLAGGFNSNVCRLLQDNIENKDDSIIITVGKKGRDYFAKRGYNIGAHYDGYTDNPSYKDAVIMGNELMKKYIKKEYDEIYLVYTTFKSTISQEPTLIKLFPIDKTDFNDKKNNNTVDMIYEPGVETVLSRILPKYIYSILYGSLVESSASEQGARMTAMDSATNNAVEMISDLTIEFNRARQDSITQELSEIVGGASALQ